MRNKIEFKINEKKSLEAVLYLASKSPGKKINIYNLLKMLFEADKYHLNQHARPVTGDCYVKMEYGTVPSSIYNLIKKEPLAFSSLELQEFPFETHGNFIIPSREPDLKVFSESDLEALNRGYEAYFGLEFKEVKDKNHHESSWQETDLNKIIDFEKIIENPEVKAYLEQLGPFSVVV
jgi:hypothetical protein